MQNSILYNKFTNLIFIVKYDPEEGSDVIEYAPVKPSWFLKKGNMPHLIFVKYINTAGTMFGPANIGYGPNASENIESVSIWCNTVLSGTIIGDIELEEWFLD